METILCSVHLPHHNYINYFLRLETPILISKGQVFQTHMWTDEENIVSGKPARRIINTCLQGYPGARGPCEYAQQISLLPGLHLHIPHKWVIGCHCAHCTGSETEVHEEEFLYPNSNSYKLFKDGAEGTQSWAISSLAK